MQAELFEMSGPVVDAARIAKPSSGWMDQFRVTLRVDHLLIGGILALVLYVLVFSFGVEKGKRYAMAELRAEKMKQEQISKELIELKPVPLPSLTPIETPGSKSKAAVPTPQAVPPSETPASTASPVAPLKGQYTIQLITFKSRKRAEQEMERLKKLGYRSFIIPQGKFFQVCTDAFKNLGEAREKLIRLKSEGHASSDAYIRPLSGLNQAF